MGDIGLKHLLEKPEYIHQFLEHSATLYPDKTAVVFQEQRLTYSELNNAANHLAYYLIDDIGVSIGDLIPLMFENSPEYVICYYGIQKAGCVAIPLGTDLKPDSLSFYLNELESEVILASNRYERLLKATPISEFGIKTAGVLKPSMPWEHASVRRDNLTEIISRETSASIPDISLSTDDLANIIFTSGSTGQPKGVMLTHRNVIENTLSICEYLKLTESDIQMVVLPFFYVMGQSLLNTHVAVGGTVVLNNTFAYPATVIQQMIDEKVTGFSGVPSTYAYLLHRSPLKSRRDDFVHLRYCSQAGGHMASHLKLSLRDVLPDHTDIYIMYGATEASARLAYLEPDQLLRKTESIGKAIPGVELFVADKQGNRLPDGEVGELMANGPNIMKGYFKDGDLTSKKLDAVGYHTGDLCYRDEEGFFFLTGREDDLLKVGGHRINPQEIEDSLMASDLIIEVALLGIPDPLMGHTLMAVAVKREDSCTENDIKNYCDRVFPKYKCPSGIIFARSLPKKASGKIDRAKCFDLIKKD